MDYCPQVISSHECFAGRIFRVRTDEVRIDENTVAMLDIVEHPGSYAVVATPDTGSLILVRQYRHAVGRELWEIPAGTVETGESLLGGAARELAEETGYRAGSVRSLGTFFMTPGFCDEVMHFVHASQLHAGDQSLDEDERITVGTFTLAQAELLVKQGQIADAKTLLALLWMQSGRGELVPAGADN